MSDEIRDEEIQQVEINEKEIMESIKLKDDDEIIEKPKKEDKPPIDENNHVIVDTTKTKDLKQDEDIDQETLDLYNEFSSFIKNKTDIEESSGIKIVIPTGIDLIDAILGGGFAVGCLNIIVGQPGGGKCLDYNQEVEIYIDELKKRIKIGELFEQYSKDSSVVDDIIDTKKDIYIKSESGDLVKIKGLIKKNKTDVYELKFEDNKKLCCAGKHWIKRSDNTFKYAEELNIGDSVLTIDGNNVKLLSKTFLKEDYVYDLSMEKEFVYYTPNGLIHHNSMIAAQTIGNGQKVYKGKMLTGFLDAEESMTTKRLYNLGVKSPKMKPYTDITIEKVFKYLEGMCLFKQEKKLMNEPSLVVWDSIANTLSEKERETKDINSVIGFKARMLSLLIPKYVSKCSEHNICFLAVNQLREKLQMGMFTPAPDLKFMGASKDMPGGTTLKFNAFQLLSVNVKSAIDTSKDGTKYPFDGFISKIKCVKNKLFTPNVEVEAVANFYNGFSNFWTNYNFLVNTKRLSSGAWNYLISDPQQEKFRTKDAETLYNENERFRGVFDDAVKEAIQIDIVDKYDK